MLVKYLSWDETLFRNPEVFDFDYIPEEFLHRDKQLQRILTNIKPALFGSAPVNTMCLGPPSTGKTTAVKKIFEEIKKECEESIVPVYVNCQIAGTKHQVFLKIFETVKGFAPPPHGLPFFKIYNSIIKKISEERKALVVALDDLNYLSNDELMNEILHSLLKAHEEGEEVKIGIIGITTDVKFSMKLDENVGAIFHPDEVYFPPYDKNEIHDILLSRAKLGFYPNVLTEEALERIVELTYNAKDLRYGLFLMKMAGLEAERRASRKIEVKDVENVCDVGKKVFIQKTMSVLSPEEKMLLKIVYEEGKISSGDLYKKLTEKIKIGYTKFYEMIERLEGIRLIDVMFDRKGKGRTRLIMSRFERKPVLELLKE